MVATVHNDAPVVCAWEDGTLRVGKTRLLVDVVVDAYQEGQTPEQIIDAYDVISLADAHRVIGYYLMHKEEVDAYMAERERLADEWRTRHEATYRPDGALIERIRAAKRARGLL